MNPAFTRPNSAIDCIWIYNDPTKGAPQLKSKFTWHPEMEIPHEGDVMNDETWKEKGLTEDHLK